MTTVRAAGSLGASKCKKANVPSVSAARRPALIAVLAKSVDSGASVLSAVMPPAPSTWKGAPQLSVVDGATVRSASGRTTSRTPARCRARRLWSDGVPLSNTGLSTSRSGQALHQRGRQGELVAYFGAEAMDGEPAEVDVGRAAR